MSFLSMISNSYFDPDWQKMLVFQRTLERPGWKTMLVMMMSHWWLCELLRLGWQGTMLILNFLVMMTNPWAIMSWFTGDVDYGPVNVIIAMTVIMTVMMTVTMTKTKMTMALSTVMTRLTYNREPDSCHQCGRSWPVSQDWDFLFEPWITCVPGPHYLFLPCCCFLLLYFNPGLPEFELRSSIFLETIPSH